MKRKRSTEEWGFDDPYVIVSRSRVPAPVVWFQFELDFDDGNWNLDRKYVFKTRVGGGDVSFDVSFTRSRDGKYLTAKLSPWNKFVPVIGAEVTTAAVLLFEEAMRKLKEITTLDADCELE